MKKNVSPIKAQHSESINCISELANSETKVTERNRSSNYSRKIPAQDPVIFYGTSWFSPKYLFIYLFIIFHRPKLGYNNLKDIGILEFLIISGTI